MTVMTSFNRNISALLTLCEKNLPGTVDSLCKGPAPRSFDKFVDVHRNKMLNKQWTYRWFVMTPMWRHCNDIGKCEKYAQLRTNRRQPTHCIPGRVVACIGRHLWVVWTKLTVLQRGHIVSKAHTGLSLHVIILSLPPLQCGHRSCQRQL